jgi:hypothetical protein
MLKNSAATTSAHHSGALRTHKLLRRGLVIAAVSGGWVFALAGPAFAAPAGDTTATFTLAGGSLDVTPALGAALTDGVTGAASVSGSLGVVAISDTRGSTAGWVLSAASTAFTGALGSVSTGVTYSSGAPTATTGTVTALTAGPGIDITGLGDVVADGTAASGNNTAAFAPTLTVGLPAGALADDYTGTVTTSIA